MTAATARLIEIRARITAGRVGIGSEARRLALRATKFVRDDALAEALADRLATELDYLELLDAMNGEGMVSRDEALKILDEIEAASR